MELRLRCWRDGGCGDTKETTGCQVGLRQASTWGHASMGHASMGRVSRRGLARRAWCCCLLLLLLGAAAAPGAAVARGYQHALQSTRAYRQAEATLPQTGKKQEVWCTPLSGGAWPIQSVRRNLANRMQRSNIISPIYGSTIIFFPNMTTYEYPYSVIFAL